MQRLIDARLIGAERAAALQYQRDAIAALRPPAFLGRKFSVRCARVHDLLFVDFEGREYMDWDWKMTVTF